MPGTADRRRRPADVRLEAQGDEPQQLVPALRDVPDGGVVAPKRVVPGTASGSPPDLTAAGHPNVTACENDVCVPSAVKNTPWAVLALASMSSLTSMAIVADGIVK